ncbi:MAG: response regulator [Rubripirellula sp.]
MSNQVLFVDDDPSLLNTMKRNLGFEYTVHIAEGAKSALEVCEKEGDFSVVLVDMQMPRINGIETIGLLRTRMPQAVFCMLTGNQDVATAIQAVNDGRVFRYLLKPCENSELEAAIDAAQKQHNLITAEKQLLSGTFAGSIRLITDLIESQEQQTVDTGRMAEALTDLAKRMSVKIGWEETVAARVFMLGIAMLDRESAHRFLTLEPSSVEHKAIFAKICNHSAALLSRLPRLGWIVAVLKAVPKAESFDSGADRTEIAAVLLRVVFYWNFLTNKGLSVEVASSIILNVIPDLSDKFVAQMECLHDNHDAQILTNVLVSRLEAGMIPGSDISMPGVGIVVAKGRPLTTAMVENLQRDETMLTHKVPVIGNSIPS